jgi:hypothetical protein
LTLMWVAGFLSAANRTSKRDFLEGRDISTIINLFQDVCKENPDIDVEHATIRVLGRLRIMLLTPEDLQGMK